ncbi:MAG TPA: hypothetical protein VF691_18955 [Cytophagaceae bacterium]|jgi:hypothetical protein
MKKIYSLSLLALVPLVNFCSQEIDEVQPATKTPKGLVVKTIDGFGRPVKSTIVYEARDCEYDFDAPEKANSNAMGITNLKVSPGYLQLYVEGFLHESYKCFTYNTSMDTLTIYGAKIPTFIETGAPNTTITYFSNTSGNCDFEANAVGTKVKADQLGKAVIYLPQSDTYKVQANGTVQCFQPDQEIHTLTF